MNWSSQGVPALAALEEARRNEEIDAWRQDREDPSASAAGTGPEGRMSERPAHHRVSAVVGANVLLSDTKWV